MALVRKTCSIANKSPASSPTTAWLCSDVFTASWTLLIYMLPLLLIPSQMEVSQLAMPGSTHTVTGLSTSPSSANTQLLLPSPLNAVRPAAQGNRVMGPWGTDINPVVTTSHKSPIYSPFWEISQHWLLDAIYQRDHYIPILFLFPSLNIPFVGRQDPMEDGSLVWSSAPDFIFWALDSHTPELSQICRGTSTASLFSFIAAYSECHPPQMNTNIHTAVSAQTQHFLSSPHPNCWT